MMHMNMLTAGNVCYLASTTTCEWNRYQCTLYGTAFASNSSASSFSLLYTYVNLLYIWYLHAFVNCGGLSYCLFESSYTPLNTNSFAYHGSAKEFHSHQSPRAYIFYNDVLLSIVFHTSIMVQILKGSRHV